MDDEDNDLQGVRLQQRLDAMVLEDDRHQEFMEQVIEEQAALRESFDMELGQNEREDEALSHGRGLIHLLHF